MSQPADAAPVDTAGSEQKGPSKNELKKLAKQQEKAAKKAAKQEAAQASAPAVESDFAEMFYGNLPLNQSQKRTGRVRTDIGTLTPNDAGKLVLFRARVSNLRVQGSKMVFFNLRQRADSIQALLQIAPEKVSKSMLKWASALSPESIVLIEGQVQKTTEEIKSASIKDVEVVINQIHLVSGLDLEGLGGSLPFSLEDANRAEADYEKDDAQFNKVHIETRLNGRVLDLRTQTNQAIFKMQAVISDLFREYLASKGFIEIHSPKLQGAATESGASVFKVGYFKGDAFLAQSPQLAKQMAIAADFERVYEIGPVFRAENSNTHRHLTEFIGLDLEMTIEEHYHEVMEMLDGLFLHIFRNLRSKCRPEIDIIRKQFPCEDFKWRDGPQGTLKLTFAEAVDMLVANGVPRETLDDIDTENEKKLGRLVLEKYDTDYYIIDKFPMALRPFYTMADAKDPKLSNSYDFFMRGEEILSGAQRIHQPQLLIEEMKKKGIAPESMKAYIDGFRMGCPPHGGGGIGLERVLMLFLKLSNIRRASLFPRDPRRLEP